MTNTIAWDSVQPIFTDRLRAPKKPERPSDGAIAMAQKSYAGTDKDGETVHIMRHRFHTVEEATQAADELRRAGAYTEPETTVNVVIDPDGVDDKRVLAWRAGDKRGRKT